MTILEDIYGQKRTVKQISPVFDDFIVVETFPKTKKVYKKEKVAVRAAHKDLMYSRSINGIIRNHWGFKRTRFN